MLSVFGRTRPTVASDSALRTDLEVVGGEFGRNDAANFRNGFTLFDEDVQVFRRVWIHWRGQNAAIAERARTKLHPSLHPGDDLVIVQGFDGPVDQLVVREEEAEMELAVFEHTLDLFGGIGAERQTVSQRIRSFCCSTPCHACNTAPRAVPAFAAAG